MKCSKCNDTGTCYYEAMGKEKCSSNCTCDSGKAKNIKPKTVSDVIAFLESCKPRVFLGMFFQTPESVIDFIYGVEFMIGIDPQFHKLSSRERDIIKVIDNAIVYLKGL